MSKLTDKTRRLVRARAQDMCELCGRPGDDPHHRQITGMGGGGDHGAANILYLDRACHDAVHESPGWAREQGWLVSRWSDPRAVPVALRGRLVVFLDDDGNYLRKVAA